MANKLWADFYDGVMPELPGLPSGTPADFFIKRAAIEFCDRSLKWQVEIPAFATVADTGTYSLAAPVAGAMVAKIMEIRYLDKELDPATPAQLRARYGSGRDWRGVTGETPTYWTSERPNQVTIVPAPDAVVADAISGWAAIKPADDATGLDEVIWREHFQTICNLAKAMAMEVPKKPYSNPQRAMQLRNSVDSDIGWAQYGAFRGKAGRLGTRTHWI